MRYGESYDLHQWKAPTVQHVGEAPEEWARDLTDGVHQFELPSGASLDFYFAGLSQPERFEREDGERVILVGLNGAVVPREGKAAPFFSGLGVAESLKVPLIAPSDPTLSVNDSLGLSWYAGNEQDLDIVPRIAEVLNVIAAHLDARLILFGGSGGGFAAIKIGALLECQASLVVWNPQTAIHAYNVDLVRKYVEAAFPAKVANERWFLDAPPTEDDFKRFFEEARLDADLYSDTLPANVELLYLQNRSDWHVPGHANRFLVPRGCRRVGDSVFRGDGERIVAWFGDWGDGHVPPPYSVLLFVLKGLLAHKDMSSVALELDAGVAGLIEKSKWFHFFRTDPEFDYELRAVREETALRMTCLPAPGYPATDGIKYAFYFLVDGQKKSVRWYEPTHEHVIALTDEAGELSIKSFAQDDLGQTIVKESDVAPAGSTAGPTPHRREFGGVPGNLVLILGLPLFTAYLYFAVRWNDGALLPGPRADWDGFLASLVPTAPAAAAYLGWLALQAALQAFLPGRIVEGTPLPGGGRLRYRMNGLATFGVTAGLAAALHLTGVLPLRFWHDQFGALLSVMFLWTAAFSVFLYAYGLRADPAPDRSGSLVHDFWMGTGHNPRVPPGGAFDLKLFCEARPGLQLWVLLNVSFAAVQWERHGLLSPSMLLVCGLQLLYILDYFWHEPAILTTMDIKHERFGYMLAFGDLVWVPMTYSLQAHYLIDRVHTLSPVWVALTLALAGLGLYVFRAVNLQKHRFRADPEGVRIWGRPAEYLETAAGGKLLCSGFWGWSRHFNYVGDILMAISWSLPCLFASPLPWFYPIYFTALLVHRERRDHRICAAKYGADWERYCRRVRWRILPGIY